MNNNIKDILKYLSVKKIPTTLFTNASFVDDELRNVSKQIGNITYIIWCICF